MTQTYHHGALREALIVAAETILERDGITALTLRAAAREAGVSHAAPSHHFGSLAGLLSELAASGFDRLRRHLVEAVGIAGGGPERHMAGLSRGYVAFARSSPGLFQLMFRSEQLDWSNAALSAAGGATFAMLLPPSTADGVANSSSAMTRLGNAMAHWSMVHGAWSCNAADRWPAGRCCRRVCKGSQRRGFGRANIAERRTRGCAA